MLLERITGRLGSFNRFITTAPSLPAPDFTSSDQTVAFDTLLDVAHSLGAVPTLVMVFLKCTTANQNYSVGDEVIMASDMGASIDRSVTIVMDATNVSIVQGVTIELIDKSTLNSTDITATSWRWVVRAWK